MKVKDLLEFSHRVCPICSKSLSKSILADKIIGLLSVDENIEVAKQDSYGYIRSPLQIYCEDYFLDGNFINTYSGFNAPYNKTAKRLEFPHYNINLFWQNEELREEFILPPYAYINEIGSDKTKVYNFFSGDYILELPRVSLKQMTPQDLSNKIKKLVIFS